MDYIIYNDNQIYTKSGLPSISEGMKRYIIQKIMKTLEKKDREMLLDMFNNGLTLDDISKKYNMARTTCYYKILKLLSQIREKIEVCYGNKIRDYWK